MAKKYKQNSRGEYEARVWDGTYNPDGSRHRKKLVSKKSSADLERKVREYQEELEQKGAIMTDDRSFYEYAKAWLSISKASAEKNTQRMYRTTIQYFKPLDEVPISEIRHSHLQQIINENLDHPKTCKNIKGALSQIVRSAIRDRLLPREAERDLLEDLSLPHYTKPKKRALTPIEKAAIGKADLDDKKMAFVLILYYCGLRRQEALALRPSCFDWEKKVVHIREVLIFVGNQSEIKDYPKSDHGLRDVPMADELIKRIKPYVESLDEDEFLFHTKELAQMTETGYRRMWQSIVTALNVAAGYNPFAKKNRGEKPIRGLTAHIFRHNYCTELCYQIPALSTKMIAKLLGDDERMVLDVYSHIVEEKENIGETINKAFDSPFDSTTPKGSSSVSAKAAVEPSESSEASSNMIPFRRRRAV